MTPYSLRLLTDRLAPGAAATLAAGLHRVLYVAEGSARVSGAGIVACLGLNSAWHGTAEAGLRAGEKGARILRWELHRGAASGAVEGPGIDSVLTLEAALSLDRSARHLMRCDRVDMPPGSVRDLHTQAGPGIRCLQSGAFHLEMGGVARDFRPGEAWFEAGPDPVFAAGSKTEASHFIRVLVLPLAYLGRRSGRTVDPENDRKQRPQTFETFIDQPIVLDFAR